MIKTTDARLVVRITPEFLKYLHSVAATQNKTLSEFVRSALQEACGFSKGSRP